MIGRLVAGPGLRADWSVVAVQGGVIVGHIPGRVQDSGEAMACSLRTGQGARDGLSLPH